MEQEQEEIKNSMQIIIDEFVGWRGCTNATVRKLADHIYMVYLHFGGGWKSRPEIAVLSEDDNFNIKYWCNDYKEMIDKEYKDR